MKIGTLETCSLSTPSDVFDCILIWFIFDHRVTEHKACVSSTVVGLESDDEGRRTSRKGEQRWLVSA